MARTFNGTNDALRATSTPVTAAPLTIACWFNQTTSAAQLLMSVGVNGGIDRFQMFTNGPGSQAVAATANQSGTTGQSVVAGAPTSGQWHHAASVFASTTSRTAYWNGTAGTPNTTSITPAGIDSIVIGSRYNTTLGAYFGGSIAEVAIWNAALSDEEIASMSKGFHPALIRPASLQFYAPLIRAVQDLRGGLSIGELGTGTTASTHPRIIYP
jgi:hypothetical protein